MDGVFAGLDPGVDHPVVVVPALPAEGARGRPGFDNQVVRLVKTLPVVHRIGIGGDAFLADTAHKATDHPPPDKMSIMAISSATRSGLSWMGSTLPRKTMRPFCVILARMEPIS